MKTFLCNVLLLTILCSCSYLKYASVQAEYSRIQDADPGQRNLKHMIDQENFFVIGRLLDTKKQYSDYYLTVVAFSDKFKKHERVDSMESASVETHYGLRLPEGSYTVLVLADLNENRIFENDEIVGQRRVELNHTVAPEKVLVQTDIELITDRKLDWFEPVSFPVTPELQKSLFYPAGTIRSLDDPLFDENVTTIGMYDPAAFNEKAPTMFYALEEDVPHKIPVVFVHGIGGSSRAFLPIVNRLDRRKYKPWFFYYPSGGDLEQLGSIFYKIFISGKIASTQRMPMIIVAHSMGGLVVREALNKYNDSKEENRIGLFVTIATPFGGHPAAAAGEKHGLIVLPSWRDVNPDSLFIRKLYRKPLPESINHHLIYAYQNSDVIKLSENSDGVVPLSSQLYPVAQKQSQDQFGFNSNHTSILENDEMITYLLEQVMAVKNFFPEEHLHFLFEAEYDGDLGDKYDPLVQYFIRFYGKYLMALVEGKLQPFYEEQNDLIFLTKEKMPPRNQLEREWLEFIRENPNFGR